VKQPDPSRRQEPERPELPNLRNLLEQ
jgi:hypothetical protein